MSESLSLLHRTEGTFYFPQCPRRWLVVSLLNVADGAFIKSRKSGEIVLR